MGIIDKTQEVLTGQAPQEHSKATAIGAGTMGSHGTSVVSRTVQQTTTATTTAAGAAATETPVCGQESFTKIEDRTRVIEHKEYLKEHHPIEREFVVETRFVGERELPEKRHTEILRMEEHVVAQAQPKGPCE